MANSLKMANGNPDFNNNIIWQYETDKIDFQNVEIIFHQVIQITASISASIYNHDLILNMDP